VEVQTIDILVEEVRFLRKEIKDVREKLEVVSILLSEEVVQSSERRIQVIKWQTSTEDRLAVIEGKVEKNSILRLTGQLLFSLIIVIGAGAAWATGMIHQIFHIGDH